jgi:hypothetical protein
MPPLAEGGHISWRLTGLYVAMTVFFCWRVTVLLRDWKNLSTIPGQFTRDRECF